MSNSATPYQVLGRGQSSLALTNEDFAVLVAEYLRYTVTEPLNVERKQVDFLFHVKVDVREL
jgi:hypothetical protein